MQNEIFQISTLKALMLGNFDGVITVEQALAKGGYGIGTFEGMGGEALAWEGTMYNAKADGSCCSMEPAATMPFGVLYDFTAQGKTLTSPPLADFEAVKHWLTQQTQGFWGNPNAFYVMRATGQFGNVLLRSCHKQQKPYLTLAQVAKDQMEFCSQNTGGYLTGVCCPDYMDGLNLPGWHIHFMDEARSRGGHILAMDCGPLQVTLEQKLGFSMVLPQNPEFAALDLCQDMRAATASVEGQSQRSNKK